MKKIYQDNLIKEVLRGFEIHQYFQQIPKSLHIVEYEPGETVSSALDARNLVQILIRGTASIYCVKEDGNDYSLAQCTQPYIIGETDFFLEKNPCIYVTAQSESTFLAVSIEQDGPQLMDDVVFLRMIANDLAHKLHVITSFDVVPSSLHQRVLNYIAYFCENQVLSGVEKSAFHLHCSPRQLQRVLNQLVLDQKLSKIGKGTYILNSEQNKSS